MNQKFWLVLLASILANSISIAEILSCRILSSTQVVSEKVFALEKQATQNFGESGPFLFKIKNQGDSKFTLEVFEADRPARHYAEAVLRQAEDQLSWALWTRESLMEANCRLNPKIRQSKP